MIRMLISDIAEVASLAAFLAAVAILANVLGGSVPV